MLADYQAATGQGPAIIEVRTRFWDEEMQRAAQRGARQFVILAAGRDARAYRLAWPLDTVLFEVDQPAVLTERTPCWQPTSRASGRRPRCRSADGVAGRGVAAVPRPGSGG